MTSRIIGIALLVIGVVTAGLSVATATVWKPADSVTATANLGKSAAPVVISAPGFLDVAGTPVTITAKSSDPKQKVVLAVGHSNEVSAWVGDAAHVTLDSLSSWSTIHTKTTKGDAAAVDPAGSDLWLAESDGTGSAKLTWKVDGGQYSLLAATDGTKPAPATISVTWPRSANISLLVPGLIVGLLLAGAGVFLLLRKRTLVPAEAPSTPVEEGRRARRLARATAPTDGHRARTGRRSGSDGDSEAPPGDDQPGDDRPGDGKPGEATSTGDDKPAGADTSASGDAPTTAGDGSAAARPMTRREARLARAAKAGEATSAPKTGETAIIGAPIDANPSDDENQSATVQLSPNEDQLSPSEDRKARRSARRSRHASAESTEAQEAEESQATTEIRPSTGMHRAITPDVKRARAAGQDGAAGQDSDAGRDGDAGRAGALGQDDADTHAVGTHAASTQAGGAPVFDWPSLRSVQGSDTSAAPEPRTAGPQNSEPRPDDQRGAGRWRAAWGVQAGESAPPPEQASDDQESKDDEGGQR